jgi:ABC-type lipoprotein export system ATPase subunit
VSVLELYGVSKSISGEVVLRRVDLVVPRGAVVAVRGRSGVGKTTLAKIASLILRPDSGRVVFLNRDVSRAGDSKRAHLRLRYIGYVDQECALIEELSVRENIELSLRLVGAESSRDAVREVLEVLGLKGLENRRPRELSGGQRQRVAIARALVKRPVLLVADEPFAHLDDETARSIMNYIRSLVTSSGMSVLITTTDLYTPLSVDRDYILENGVLRERT